MHVHHILSRPNKKFSEYSYGLFIEMFSKLYMYYLMLHVPLICKNTFNKIEKLES